MSLIDVPGGAADVARVRAEVVQGLVDNGYRLVDTDQEPGSEAEAEDAGPYDGTCSTGAAQAAATSAHPPG